MERIFRTNLKRELQARINGDIIIHIISDTLIIDIHSIPQHTFRYTINNIGKQILTGLSSRTVANIVVQNYKNDILSHYFT